ncbi:PssE/Cps14G family polysaccharide biosynthesis glycosyltransferase [Vibrio owensii]|uniref:PssE/Cps14G family polysaccharide biosynthesis glycosyltransferase n=1 Tax=Vibrio owensii TaxID=696485 RepID=UPI0018F13C28
MKYLVTVGTTAFDSLVRVLDTELKGLEIEIIFQIGEGKYTPQNFEFFHYTSNILDKYEDYVFITHAGAGTVFSLLDKERRFIAIPNLERKDKHQIELANYLDVNNYAEVCYDIDELVVVIKNSIVREANYAKYEKVEFFKGDDISLNIKRSL